MRENDRLFAIEGPRTTSPLPEDLVGLQEFSVFGALVDIGFRCYETGTGGRL